jgi:predicted phage-related endonuclease
MALTDTQKLARAGKLTASRVAPLMTGDKAKIMAVWRELCGDPAHEEEDLSDIWAVQLGSLTESLNLDWYEKIQNKPITKRGEVIVHPNYDWAAATLDGFDATIPGPVECKHVSGFEKAEVVLQRYQPQLHWQMEVTQTRKCAFSVINGGRQPHVEIVEYDKDYADELMARALRLMEHVWNMTPPVELEPVELKRISRLVDYNMTGNNQWAAAAADYLSHHKAAKLFKSAEETIRGIIPNDAASATGYGLIAKRDKANRVSIKPLSDDKPGPKPRDR